jgi:hypothetical protein
MKSCTLTSIKLPLLSEMFSRLSTLTPSTMGSREYHMVFGFSETLMILCQYVLSAWKAKRIMYSTRHDLFCMSTTGREIYQSGKGV